MIFNHQVSSRRPRIIEGRVEAAANLASEISPPASARA
jgi:hypothetical protein